MWGERRRLIACVLAAAAALAACVAAPAGREVYRDGKLLATTKRTTWLDATAGPAQRHTYTVRAVDPGGRSV